MGESPKERARDALGHHADVIKERASELEGNARVAMEMKAEQLESKAETMNIKNAKERGNTPVRDS